MYTQDNTDNRFITAAFELKFLDYIGFKPIVNKCINCECKILQNSVFNIYEGGILCSKCSKLFDNNIKLDLTTISLMEYVLRNDILTCSKAKVSKYITHELENILDKYLKVYVDNINFKSLHVLQSVKNNKEWIMMSSNITIEMVDSVFERVPGATYAEAKEALVMCNGDVIEAVIYLENKKILVIVKQNLLKKLWKKYLAKMEKI